MRMLHDKDKEPLIPRNGVKKKPPIPKRAKKKPVHEMIESEEEVDDQDDEELESGKKGKKEDPKSNFTSTTFNLCNSVLGAGVIGLPFAVKEAGFGLAIILIIAMAAAADYTLCLLIHAGKLAGTHQYADTMRVAFGKCGVAFLVITSFGYALIVMTGYNMILGDNATKLLIRITHFDDVDELRSHFWGRRELIILFAILATTMPLSLYRHMSKLAKWSSLAILVLFIIIMLLAVRLASLDLPIEPSSYQFANIDFIQSLGIISGAYLCHHSSFLIYNSMRRPTERRLDEVTHVTLVITVAIMLSFGIIGYATFTENTEGNILQNYCGNDDVINAARFLFILSIVLSFPIEVFVARNLIENLFFSNSQPPPLYRHVAVTLFIVFSTYGLALITECLGIVLEISGLLLAIPLAYIYPPLLVLKLQPLSLFHYKNIPMYTLLLTALGILFGGMYVTMVELIEEGVTCSEGQEPSFCLAGNGTNGTIFP